MPFRADFAPAIVSPPPPLILPLMPTPLRHIFRCHCCLRDCRRYFSLTMMLSAFRALLFHAIRCHAAIISPRHAITPFSPYFAALRHAAIFDALFIFAITIFISLRHAMPPCRHAYAIAAAVADRQPRRLRATFRR
jgi:hypothetical protein